uniref:Putative secreted protein n=1 Tax=Ixodes ricinus TaxID=34613 RepID=A0A6B0UGA2_IXORI
MKATSPRLKTTPTSPITTWLAAALGSMSAAAAQQGRPGRPSWALSGRRPAVGADRHGPQCVARPGARRRRAAGHPAGLAISTQMQQPGSRAEPPPPGACWQGAA